VKNNCGVPSREEFRHIFCDCPAIDRLRRDFFTVFYVYNFTDDEKRLFLTTGICKDVSKRDLILNVLTIYCFNYILWQNKLRKTISGLATVLLEVENLFNLTLHVSSSLRKAAQVSDLNICRRWRGPDEQLGDGEGGGGEGP